MKLITQLVFILLVAMISCQQRTLNIPLCGSGGQCNSNSGRQFPENRVCYKQKEDKLLYACCGDYRLISNGDTASCVQCSKAGEGCTPASSCNKDECCDGL
ncbi:unnamed protein product, partial [Adineta steineri]